MTNGKHLTAYAAFGTVLALLALTGPLALTFGFLGAVAARSRNVAIAWLGQGYAAFVRGIPDIIFFLFFVIALDQGFEWLRHQWLCPEWTEPIRQGNDFLVCPDAKLPLSNAPQWVHEMYGFLIAAFTFAIVFGAFAANVLMGAMRAVPHGQIETAQAFGMSERQAFWRIMVPQMWRYALPGLSNIWQILIKATPLLFLLGVEDIVYWARELGGSKGPIFDYPHPDWRRWYFLALLVFYLFMTWLSERVFRWLTRRANRGHGAQDAALEAGRS